MGHGVFLTANKLGFKGVGRAVKGGKPWAKSEESGRLLPSTLHYGWRLLPSTSCGMWASRPRGSLLAVFLGQGRRAKRRPACRPAWRLRQVAMASQEAGLRKPVNGLARDVGNCLGKSLGNTAFFPSAG
ncbi:unnamed protein product [Sphagnum jensenii]|uniref:Uncharacterized protein n=1 Tax=Sphagnum jensenii TaxID=128206 RepID=A0ABP0VGE3_9BRYO